MNIPEIVIVEVSQNTELATIEDYRKMGFSLKSSQTFPKLRLIKLIFERSVDLPNYNILKDRYNCYRELNEKISYVRSHQDDITLKRVVTPVSVAIITATILFILYMNNILYNSVLFIVCLVIFPLLLGGLAFAVQMAVISYKHQNFENPEITKLKQQVQAVLKDAEKYV